LPDHLKFFQAHFVFLRDRWATGLDLRQAGSRASLTTGAPVTSSCSDNRGTPFLWKTL